MNIPRPCENPDCHCHAQGDTKHGDIVDDLESLFYGKWLCVICLAALKRWKESRAAVKKKRKAG